MTTAIETSEPNTARSVECTGIPDVRTFSREQQDVLLTALVKILLEEMETPTFVPVMDGEKQLAVILPTRTERPLHVITDDIAEPYINLLVSQLPGLCKFLDEHGIPYTVDEMYISLNNGPESTTLNLDRNEDAPVVQALLDSIQ